MDKHPERVVKFGMNRPPENPAAAKVTPSPGSIESLDGESTPANDSLEDRAEARALAWVFALTAAVLAFGAARERWGGPPVRVERAAAHELDWIIDINAANPIELANLPGIGHTLAERIVDDRKKNGPYANLEDIQRVKGIGPKLLEKMRPYLRVKAPSNPPRKEPAMGEAAAE
jgi:competence protein ComEA